MLLTSVLRLELGSDYKHSYTESDDNCKSFRMITAVLQFSGFGSVPRQNDIALIIILPLCFMELSPVFCINFLLTPRAQDLWNWLRIPAQHDHSCVIVLFDYSPMRKQNWNRILRSFRLATLHFCIYEREWLIAALEYSTLSCMQAYYDWFHP